MKKFQTLKKCFEGTPTQTSDGQRGDNRKLGRPSINEIRNRENYEKVKLPERKTVLTHFTKKGGEGYVRQKDFSSRKKFILDLGEEVFEDSGEGGENRYQKGEKSKQMVQKQQDGRANLGGVTKNKMADHP